MSRFVPGFCILYILQVESELRKLLVSSAGLMSHDTYIGHYFTFDVPLLFFTSFH